MPSFSGFPEGKIKLTPVPGQFFTDLLPEVDHLGELKVILYAFWQLYRKEGAFRFMRRVDFAGDERFMQGMGKNPREAEIALDDSLERAVGRGVLLKALLVSESGEQAYYFLNSPKGRAAIEAIRSGQWLPSADLQASPVLNLERPNIFRLYEEHIGPLTPMIAETLREAEKQDPEVWIADAIRIAVEKNARNWRYVEAILRRWQEEGRDEQDRGDAEKDGRRYIEGKYSDYIEH